MMLLALAGISAFSCRELVRISTEESPVGLRLALGIVSTFAAFGAGIAARGPLQLPASTQFAIGNDSQRNHSKANNWLRSICSFACRLISRNQRPRRIYAKEGLGDNCLGAGPNILIAVTGSVAAVKVPELASHLRRLSPNCQLRIVCSAAGARMLAKCAGYDAAAWRGFRALGVEILDDSDEWCAPHRARPSPAPRALPTASRRQTLYWAAAEGDSIWRGVTTGKRRGGGVPGRGTVGRRRGTKDGGRDAAAADAAAQDGLRRRAGGRGGARGAAAVGRRARRGAVLRQHARQGAANKNK